MELQLAEPCQQTKGPILEISPTSNKERACIGWPRMFQSQLDLVGHSLICSGALIKSNFRTLELSAACTD